MLEFFRFICGQKRLFVIQSKVVIIMELYQIGKSNSKIHMSPMHIHRHCEIIYNLSGSGIIALNDGTILPFAENTVAVIPAGTGHEKTAEKGFSDIWLKLSGAPFNDGKVKILSGIECQKIKTLMEMCLEWYAGNDTAFAPAMRVAVNLIDELLHLMCDPKRYDEDVERFIQTVAMGFSNPEFDLGESITVSGYCPDYFRRKFKKQTGFSPLEYLNKTRLDYAKRILERSDSSEYSIGEIAYFSGFYDQRYFSRMFKKQFGYCPKETRG